MQKNRIHEVIPNDAPDGIMPDDKLTPLFRMAIRHEIEESRAKGLPIAHSIPVVFVVAAAENRFRKHHVSYAENETPMIPAVTTIIAVTLFPQRKNDWPPPSRHREKSYLFWNFVRIKNPFRKLLKL